MQPRLYHLHALSALHCGTGQAADVVDLPIARARATNLPLVPGSSLRGVLREEFADREYEKVLFGPRNISGNDESHAGALALGDAHLLLFPVRALAGIVAYVTCPFILKRYAKDAGESGKPALTVPEPGNDEALHASGNQNGLALHVHQAHHAPHAPHAQDAHGNKIVLEDLDLNARHEPQADAWADRIASAIFKDDATAQTDLKQRFLILPDAVFAFLAETATEIRARIAINKETGTVKKGALWYEENLPAESILWGVFALSNSRIPKDGTKADALAAQIPAKLLLQLGGKGGVGRGLVHFLNGSAQ